MSSGFDSHRSSTSSGSTGDSLDDVPLTLQDSDSEQDRPRAGNRLAAPVARLTLQNAAGTGPSGVPKLSLASIPNPSLSMATTRRQHADYPTAPQTHRGPPPSLPLPPQGRPVPKLSLASAAGPAAAASGPSSGLIPSGRHTSSPAFHRSSPSHAAAEDASSAHTVQVSLLSMAFSWSCDVAAGSSSDDTSSSFDQLQVRCSSALGITPSQLDLYELRRLDAASFTAAAGQKVAFAVQGNRFTLQELERLLREQGELRSANSQQAAELHALQQQLVARPTPRSGRDSTEQQVSQQQLEQLRLENRALRAKLDKSRAIEREHYAKLQQLQDAYRQLRRDYESTRRGAGAGAGAGHAAPAAAQLVAPGPVLASANGGLMPHVPPEIMGIINQLTRVLDTPEGKRSWSIMCAQMEQQEQQRSSVSPAGNS